MPDRVTIRLQPGKEQVYAEFKELVTDRLHSDICYVITELMETFTAAVNQTPAPSPVVMRFLKQNIQLNMGCTFHYNTRRAKRLPTDRQLLEVQKNQVLPNLVDMWKTLKPEAQRFWLHALTEAGVIPERKQRRQRGSRKAAQRAGSRRQPADKCHTQKHKRLRKLQRAFRKFHKKLRGVLKWKRKHKRKR